MKQSRNYCFTDFEILDFEVIYKEYKDIIRYICYGLEQCPKTKKKHLQGWVQFYNKKTLGGVKRIFGSKKTHLESCRGNEYDNDKYCKKDNKFMKFGVFITQGYRSDLEKLKKDIDDGKKMINIAEDNFSNYIRYHSGIEKYKALREKEKTKKFRKLNVKVLWGKTGTGKTKLATNIEGEYYKIEGSNMKWWNGYEQEKNLIIDEYNNDINITKLLNILDGYQLRLDIKGSHTYANWNNVIITSNINPNEWHMNAKYEHRLALLRRITEIAEVK